MTDIIEQYRGAAYGKLLDRVQREEKRMPNAGEVLTDFVEYCKKTDGANIAGLLNSIIPTPGLPKDKRWLRVPILYPKDNDFSVVLEGAKGEAIFDIHSLRKVARHRDNADQIWVELFDGHSYLVELPMRAMKRCLEEEFGEEIVDVALYR